MSNVTRRRNSKETKRTPKERFRGYDLLQIIQTGHVTYVDVQDINDGLNANVVVAVRSSVGLRYDKDFDDHNEVTIFWKRFYKDPEQADKFADILKKGMYVTVIGTRQDYNKKNKDGEWETLFENYVIDEIKWGKDFSETPSK